MTIFVVFIRIGSMRLERKSAFDGSLGPGAIWLASADGNLQAWVSAQFGAAVPVMPIQARRLAKDSYPKLWIIGCDYRCSLKTCAKRSFLLICLYICRYGLSWLFIEKRTGRQGRESFQN
jgi:hypothetical protein